MAVNIGPKIGIDGEAEYRKEINNIIQQAKTLDAEMKAVQSSFNEQTKSQADAAKEAEIYNKQIEVQQERVNKLAEMVERSAEATGESSTETLKWKEALANAQTELNGMVKAEEENVTWIDKLKSAAASAGPAIKNGIETAAKAAVASLAALTAAAGAAIVAIGKEVAETAAYGDEIDKMSQKMGMSIEGYQEWDYIMQHCGTSMSTLQSSMKTLATAAETGKDAFDRLGISQQEIASMNQEQLFEATISALQGVTDETERTYLAGQLLGRGATELGPLLNMTTGEVDEMKDTVHALGGVMSEDAVKQSAAFQDNVQDLQVALKGLTRGMATEFLPGINEVMKGLIAIFSGDSDGGLKMIESGVDKVVNNITDKLPKFLEAGTRILNTIVQAIIQNLPKLLESAGEIVGELIAGIISFLPQLVAMAPDIIMAVIKGIGNAMPHITQAGKDLVKALLDAIKGLLGSILQVGKDIINSIWDGIKTLNPLQWGRDLISNFIQGIKDKFAALKSSVKNIASTVKSMLGFSEPEEGPLSDFHTYAPDMMKLFAKGITDNAKLVSDAAARAFNLEPTIAAASGSEAGTSAVNYGGFNFVINAAEGQDVNQIADAVMERIETVVGIRGAVFA